MTAFRWSAWSEALMMAQPVKGLAEEDRLIEALTDGRLVVSPVGAAPGALSGFQVWLMGEESNERHVYQLTPASMSAAAAQVLKISHLETLLSKYANNTPPSLVRRCTIGRKRAGRSKSSSCDPESGFAENYASLRIPPHPFCG